MNRNFFRDYFRRRRVLRHVAYHGERYAFHGLEVSIPLSAGYGAGNALLRGKYERAEAELISRYLPADRPVIELGGSLGVVSALIGSRLASGVRHLVVEANPDILETCRGNATNGGRKADTEVLHAALSHDGPKAEFLIGAEVHANALRSSGGKGRLISVDTTTLDTLWRQIGSIDGFTLVSDIEGGEAAIFLKEPEALKHAGVVIMEMHPDSYRATGVTTDRLLAIAKECGLHQVDQIDDTVVLVRK